MIEAIWVSIVRNGMLFALMRNQGTTGMDMTRIISLNTSAKLLYESLSEKVFTLEDAAAVLVSTYGILQEQALKDAQVWVEALQKCKVIE